MNVFGTRIRAEPFDCRSQIQITGFPKHMRNCHRDAENLAVLEAIGWRVLTVWECVLKEKDKLESKLRLFLGKPKFIQARIRAKL